MKRRNQGNHPKADSEILLGDEPVKTIAIAQAASGSDVNNLDEEVGKPKLSGDVNYTNEGALQWLRNWLETSAPKGMEPLHKAEIARGLDVASYYLSKA